MNYNKIESHTVYNYDAGSVLLSTDTTYTLPLDGYYVFFRLIFFIVVVFLVARFRTNH